MNENLIMELKPKFNLIAVICSNLLVILITCLLLLSMFGPLFAISVEKNGGDAVRAFILSSVGIVALILFLVVLNTLMNYLATRYTVYNNRIDFEEGFIDHKNTTINLKDIREIHLTRSLIQRICGLGTIRFVTAANTSDSTSGVKFNDIQNSRKVYEQVRELHENFKN